MDESAEHDVEYCYQVTANYLSGESFPKNKDEFYKEINHLIENDDLDKAINTIENFLADNSDDIKAMSLYIECLSGAKKFQDTKKFIESLSETIITDQNIQKAINK